MIRCFVSLLLLCCLSLRAATYYVATTGSDSTGDGSVSTPWATLDKALSYASLAAGDTISIGAGTFSAVANTDISGAAWNPIAITGSGTNATFITGTLTIDEDYYTITACYFNKVAVGATANNITISRCSFERSIYMLSFSDGSSNCVVFDCGFRYGASNGMFDIRGSHHTISNCVFSLNNGNDVHRINNCDNITFVGNSYIGITSAPSEATTSSSSVAVGTGVQSFEVSAGLSTYTTNSRVKISADSENKMTGWVQTYSGTTLTVDVVTTSGSGTFSAWTINHETAGNHADIWQYFASAVHWRTHNIRWERNLIVGGTSQICNGSADYLSIGFHDHTFINNLIISNRLYWNNSASNFFVMNNVVFAATNTTTGFLDSIPRSDEHPPSMYVYNNIFCRIGGVESAGVYAGAEVADYNLITDVDDTDKTGYSEANGINGGYTPAQIFTDPANGNFTLKAGSPAIDSGADLSAYFTTDYLGNARPAGAWDIGAYEYGGSTPPDASTNVVMRVGGAVRAGSIKRR
jgi:hypothetical protein